MLRKRLYLFIYVVLMATGLLQAQSIAFHPFMAADGLSDNNVLCGLQDRYGFMWLGTNNGLNCFDGMQNTIFRNMVDDNSTFENNTITALYEHGEDIWFGGSFGLYIYHRNTKSFSRFDKRTKYGVSISGTVQDIVGSQNGYIWIGTLGQGLFIYNPKTDQLIQDSRHGAFVCDILAKDDSPVFVATLQGNVFLYSQKGDFLMEHVIKNYKSDKNNISIELIDYRLYIGTENGLFTILRNNDEIEAVQGVNIGIRSVLRKGKDLLLGTDNGIYLYQTSKQQLTRFDNPDDKQNGLSDYKINKLLWGRDSTLWVFTQMGGACYQPYLRSNVQVISLPGKSSGMINTICEALDGHLWIGTGNNLFIYDPSTQQIAPYPIVNDEINSLLVDGNDLWIGTRHHGIIVLDTMTGHQRSYQYSPDRTYTVPSNEITSLLRSSQGDIYVGTSWGLCRFDRKAENFMWYFEIGSMTYVTSLTEDKNGCVWAATSNHGLFQQTGPGEHFRNFTYNHNQSNTIGGNNISSVFCDHGGTVWIAITGGGLYRFVPENDTFEPFGVNNPAIEDQQIYFIVEDINHNLWMGVDTGILKIDSRRNANTAELLQPGEDLLRKQKPHNSAILTSRGEIFAGRYNRLVHFYPEQIRFTKHETPVYISSVTLPYHSNDNGKVDRKELTWPFTDEKITLPYTDNSFTLHFASPSFKGNDSGQRYEYMLEGLDNTWAIGTKNAEATYSNVPPGTYTFLLRKAGNTDENSYARLKITILPPWYRTTIAYVIYALFIAAIIFYLQQRYIRKLRRRYNRRMKEFQTEQEKANFESKIRFFINLVHEIRTPLTLMNLPLEAIGEQVKDNHVEKHLSAVRRNMNYLLGITNQLLDFQKAESGHIQINLSNCDIGQLLTDIYMQFVDAMEVQAKRIQLQLPEQPITTAIDVDKIQKVMMNLVGNAAKYARTEIILRLEQTSLDQLCVSVIDDGPGVPVEERDKIFDLYHQIGYDSVAATLGTGLGLTYAKMLAQAHEGDLLLSDSVGGGSNFQLVLPIRQTNNKVETANAIAQEETAEVDVELVNKAQRSFRILLVEDNEELLQMTTDALKSYYRILKAHDGVEALDLLKYNDVDVIVSDVMMPRMDGIELCQRVKNDINYSHIPVILLTAKTSVDAKTEGMQSGADVYLEKPFSSKQLYLQITSLLRMRQQFYERMRNIDGSQPFGQEGIDAGLGINHQDLQFMERLQQMVAENMRDEEFSIDLLAEQMNMSRSSFYRKIKALTDMTPIEYLKTRRLEQAALYLRQGIRITEVAERVGFTSSSYFAKCFKAKFGCLPKDYQGQQDKK